MERHVLIAYRIHAMIVGKIIKLLLSRNKNFLSYVGTKSLQRWSLPSSIVVSVLSTWHLVGLLNCMFLCDSLVLWSLLCIKVVHQKRDKPLECNYRDTSTFLAIYLKLLWHWMPCDWKVNNSKPQADICQSILFLFVLGLCSAGPVWQTCVSVRSIKTATASHSWHMPEPVREKGWKSSGCRSTTVQVSILGLLLCKPLHRLICYDHTILLLVK